MLRSIIFFGIRLRDHFHHSYSIRRQQLQINNKYEFTVNLVAHNEDMTRTVDVYVFIFSAMLAALIESTVNVSVRHDQHCGATAWMLCNYDINIP